MSKTPDRVCERRWPMAARSTDDPGPSSRHSLRRRTAVATVLAGSALFAVTATAGAQVPAATGPAAMSPPAHAAFPWVRVVTIPAPAVSPLASAITTATPMAVATGSVATSGEVLLPGRELHTGRYRLLLTRNGNLQFFAGSAHLWSSNTAGHPRARATMQPDGNLVVRTRGGKAIWSTRTAGRPGARLLVRNAAEVVVQSRAGRIVWRTTQTGTSASSATSVKGYAMAALVGRGWTGSGEWSCLESLWQRESGWSSTAANPSGAYGIPQALPGSKMASAGADWRTNPVTQIRWGLSYIAERYGSPCGAWSHSESSGWY